MTSKLSDAEICMTAARLIERDGWCKLVMRSQSGRHCALGAIQDSSQMGSANVAHRVFGSWCAVASFNDAHDTTQDEVIALLESGAYSL